MAAWCFSIEFQQCIKLSSIVYGIIFFHVGNYRQWHLILLSQACQYPVCGVKVCLFTATTLLLTGKIDKTAPCMTSLTYYIFVTHSCALL